MTQRTHDSARRPTYLRWAVAFGCWVAVIWGHSLIQGPQSSLESGLVVSLVRPLFELAGIHDLGLMTLVVRKLAHFSEYAILGVLEHGLFHARRVERGCPPFPAAYLVALVPVVDECLQLFVPGRSGQSTDVLIDLAGLVFGVAISWVVSRVRTRRRERG